MKLYITEKQSVATALEPILGRKANGAGGLSYITKDNNTVTWLSGHVLGLFDAKDYDEKYKKWNLSNLPIIPSPFKLKPPSDTKENSFKRKILKNVLHLIEKADEICLVTDPDAEGELLGREVVEYSGFQGKLTRILPTSLEVDELKEKVEQEFCASKTVLTGLSGKARSHIDWIIGINTTVGLTCFNSNKINAKLNTGRVQAAITQILYLNYKAIADFKPQATYNIKAKLFVSDTELVFDYIPTKNEKEILDPKSEEYDSAKANKVVETLATRLNNKDGVIIKCDKESKSDKCPKGFALSDLQIEANKKHGLSAVDTLAAAQKLYDNKYLTYPRTDNSFFPEAAHSYASIVLKNIEEFGFMENISGVDSSIKNEYWDTTKFENHHAILPTRTKPNIQSLSANEKLIYELVCKRYIMQFLPDYSYDKTTIIVEIEDAQFRTSGKITNVLGWKQVLSTNQKNTTDDSDDDTSAEEDKTLPMVKVGTKCLKASVFTLTGKTKSPTLYNEARLLSVLKNPASLMDSKKLAKVLKDRKQGIGRESTRATILSSMKMNGYYTIDSKKRWSLTKKGLMMAQILPPLLLDLELTAKLEESFGLIESGKITYDDLLSEYKIKTKEIVDSIKNGECELKEYLVKNSPCCYCKTGTMIERVNQKKTKYWLCNDCDKTAFDNNGKPEAIIENENCLKCNQKTLRSFTFKGSTEEKGWYCKDCSLVLPNLQSIKELKIYNCEKCNSHVNFGFSSKINKNYWRCSNNQCNTFYNDNDKKLGSATEKKTALKADCPKCKGELVQRTRRSDQKKFWICLNREVKGKECKASYEDDNDKPLTSVLEVACPSCKDGILTLKDFQGRKFWGCCNYNNKRKQCKFTAKDNNGEPMLLLNS